MPTPKNGPNAPRLADIARQAGVTRMAVSAVLMGTGKGKIRVSRETAERIQRIAKEINYRPNQAAQHLAGNRSGVIAIVAKDWKNYLTQSALSWLHGAAEEKGFRILTGQETNGLDCVRGLVRDLQAGWIDGLIYLAYLNEAWWPEVSKILQDATAATVIAVGEFKVPGIPSIISDYGAGAAESMRHLIEQRGRKRLVLVTEELETPFIRARIKAYQQVAAELGITFGQDQIIVAGLGWDLAEPAHYQRFDQLAALIRLGHKADGVLCDSDFTAAALLRAFRRLRVEVPEDVSVIGWGDLQFAEATDPMITTVSYEMLPLLSRAVSCLERRIQKSASEPSAVDQPLVEYVTPRLIIRESS